jgi:hypothetical protein
MTVPGQISQLLAQIIAAEDEAVDELMRPHFSADCIGPTSRRSRKTRPPIAEAAGQEAAAVAATADSTAPEMTDQGHRAPPEPDFPLAREQGN